MCIISDEIIAVSDTKIFVAPDPNKQRQYVCYSNSVINAVNSNIMILPVPNPQTLQFIDLTNYKDIFDICNEHFHDPNPSFNDDEGVYRLSCNSTGTLHVLNVGSYSVSVGMCLDDLLRVDKSVFVLSDELIDVMKKYYSGSFWGFIVCKLKKGPEKYHPLAYSHDIYNGKIFIPTRHYHVESSTGTGARARARASNQFHVSGYNSTGMFDAFGSGIGLDTGLNSGINAYNPNKKMYKEMADDWSHDIYLCNIDSRTNPNIKKMNSCTYVWDRKFDLDRNKMGFDVGRCDNFEKVIINGEFPNMDIIIPVV